MISFHAELDTAREHVRSTFIAATDQKIEESRRADLAAVAQFQHESHGIQHAFYQLTATLQSNCWMDPALSGAVLQRLQDWEAAEKRLKGVQEQLTSMSKTLECLDPLIGATDVRSHIVNDRMCITDINLLEYACPAVLQFRLLATYVALLAALDITGSSQGEN